MPEVGLFRRAAPAVILAVAGGILLYLLPSGADSDEGVGSDEGAGFDASPSAPSSAASGPPATTAASSAVASSKRVVVGDAIDFKFGTVQVKVALDGTTIVNIATLSAPGGGYQRYTDRAIPAMKTKILAAQSTDVSAVSGATYTSEAYAQSVQSALDKA